MCQNNFCFESNALHNNSICMPILPKKLSSESEQKYLSYLMKCNKQVILSTSWKDEEHKKHEGIKYI